MTLSEHHHFRPLASHGMKTAIGSALPNISEPPPLQNIYRPSPLLQYGSHSALTALNTESYLTTNKIYNPLQAERYYDPLDGTIVTRSYDPTTKTFTNTKLSEGSGLCTAFSVSPSLTPFEKNREMALPSSQPTTGYPPSGPITQPPSINRQTITNRPVFIPPSPAAVEHLETERRDGLSDENRQVPRPGRRESFSVFGDILGRELEQGKIPSPNTTTKGLDPSVTRLTTIGGAIPLIYVNKICGKEMLQINNEAEDILHNVISNRKLSIVSLTGPFQSGKSFLGNMLSDRSPNGHQEQPEFRVGDSGRPCTEGIWMSMAEIDEHSPVFLFLDAEGLGAPERSSFRESTLFSLVVLISHCVIYNIRGLMKQETVEELHKIISDVEENFPLPDSTTHWRPPTLFVTLRDFGVVLENSCGVPVSADEYFETVLATLPSSRRFQDVFGDRCCRTLPVPMVEDFPSAEHYVSSKVRPEFLGQVSTLKKEIIKEALISQQRSKMPLCGTSLQFLLDRQVNAMNESRRLDMSQTWAAIQRDTCQQLATSLGARFECEVNGKWIDGVSPRKIDDFNRFCKETRKVLSSEFAKRAFGDINTMEQYREKLKQQCMSIQAQHNEDAERKARDRCLTAIDNLSQNIHQKVLTLKYANSDEVAADLDALYDDYIRYPCASMELMQSTWNEVRLNLQQRCYQALDEHKSRDANTSNPMASHLLVNDSFGAGEGNDEFECIRRQMEDAKREKDEAYRKLDALIAAYELERQSREEVEGHQMELTKKIDELEKILESAEKPRKSRWCLFM